MNVELLNYILALGTLVLQIVTVALVFAFVMRKKVPMFNDIAAPISSWGLWIGFALSLASSALTLYYSDVLGFEPCPLCWWQRVFMYPQVVLLGMAAWKKDLSIASYSIMFSVLGAGVAFYQHALQMFGEGSLPCPAVGTGPSCAQRILFEFGYITFPLMAFTLFAFLIVLMLFVRTQRAL